MAINRAAMAFAALALAGVASGFAPGTDLFVPSVGHGGGQEVNGVRAQWRADVWIYNPSATQAATVDLFLLVRGQTNLSPASRRYTINAGEVRYLQDVVYGEFGLDSTYGALRCTSNLPVFLTGTSYDANVTVETKGRGVGSAGQFFAGLPATAAISAGEVVDLFGLDQDGVQTNGTWRSNLALVETSGSPVDIEIQRVDTAGTTVDSRTLTLQGREARQIDYVITYLVGSPGSNQRIRVLATGGSGRVLATASRIDNRTGDPSTIEMAGATRDGLYLCKLDKTTFDTVVNMTVSGSMITAVEAVVLFTDEDAGATCANGELLRINQTLASPIVIEEDGLFSFVVSGTVDTLRVSLQLVGRLANGQVRGTGITTLTGSAGCSGSKTWPLVGARL
jgi:hypothetical protein